MSTLDRSGWNSLIFKRTTRQILYKLLWDKKNLRLYKAQMKWDKHKINRLMPVSQASVSRRDTEPSCAQCSYRSQGFPRAPAGTEDVWEGAHPFLDKHNGKYFSRCPVLTLDHSHHFLSFTDSESFCRTDVRYSCKSLFWLKEEVSSRYPNTI